MCGRCFPPVHFYFYQDRFCQRCPCSSPKISDQGQASWRLGLSGLTPDHYADQSKSPVCAYMRLCFVTVWQITGYYGKCLMKVEPAATFTTQFNHLPVTHPSMPPLAVDAYGGRDYRLINGQTPQRILPPPEPDYMLTASKWSPPFSVCHEQLPRRRDFLETRASDVDDCPDAAMPVEMRSHTAIKETHGKISDYEYEGE